MLSRALTARPFLHALVLALGAVVAVCIYDSTVWVRRPFMGFLLGRNHIAAPIGLPHWTGFTEKVPFGARLVRVDGAPAPTVPRLVEETWGKRPGTPVRYAFETRAGIVERTVPVMVLSLTDHLSLFGTWILNGGLFLALGLVVAYLKPARPASAAMLVFSVGWGLTLLLSCGDFYAFHFRSLYAFSQALTPAALVVLAMTLPDRALPRQATPLLAALGALTAVHAALDIGLYERAPAAWMRFFEASLIYLAGAAVAACGLLARAYRSATPDGRVRLRVVGLGAIVALGLPALVQLALTVTGEQLPLNLTPILTTLFPLAIAYAVLKHDLLAIDPLLTRSVFYAALTALVTIGYVGLLALVHLLQPGVAFGMSAWWPFLFTLGVIAVVAPLRRAVQSAVDRHFFRSRYDVEATVEAVSRTLTASLERPEIAANVRRTLAETVAPAPCLLLLRDGDGWLRDEGGLAVSADDPLLAVPAGPGAVVATLNGQHGDAADRLRREGATLAIPLRVESSLEGVLALGPKRSGAPYGARDLGLLRTLGNQAAIALRNAASYAAVRDLTATLEQRVADRTADLQRTHTRLLETQQHLARADKLASLGRLVAGIAHEINNPVAFVSSSVDLIHDGARRIRARVDGTGDRTVVETLDQLLENAAICRDGAERAARIVRDLTAFSRAQPNKREPTDLHASVDRTLQLLRGEYRDRIEIVRDLGAVPQPLCNAGEIDQVVMNLLTNAVQAIDGPGEIRVRTWAENGSVFLQVRDSGRGIPAALQERIFEPFFTTRDGKGTGLGLAIAHSLVARHGGELSVVSAPGRGASFTIRLPLVPAAGADGP
jgi:two-component system NtrC family sensor kinase